MTAPSTRVRLFDRVTLGHMTDIFKLNENDLYMI